MLTARDEAAELASTAHRAKLAYVYVRQSTAVQVRQHQESTEPQYRLVGRAAGLGRPRERIAVIDDDLGKSGASAVERQGFQRLVAEIGSGKAGLALSLDASPLARNNRDRHQLLELCSVFGVLIGDGERLYDPGAYRDRLLLGLSGIMSEAELHQIRMRLHQGERQKAARGELRMSLPAGLAQERGGGIALNPDEEVHPKARDDGQSRLFEAARDTASEFLAALGTSLCLLGLLAALYLVGFFDAIYAAAVDCAAVLDKLPYQGPSAVQPAKARGDPAEAVYDRL